MKAEEVLRDLLYELGAIKHPEVLTHVMLARGAGVVDQLRDSRSALQRGKRVVRVLAYEGDPAWIDRHFDPGERGAYIRPERPFSCPAGRISEVAREEVEPL